MPFQETGVGMEKCCASIVLDPQKWIQLLSELWLPKIMKINTHLGATNGNNNHPILSQLNLWYCPTLIRHPQAILSPCTHNSLLPCTHSSDQTTLERVDFTSQSPLWPIDARNPSFPCQLYSSHYTHFSLTIVQFSRWKYRPEYNQIS